MNTPSQEIPDIVLDSQALYREETFTDRQVGTLRRMTPIKIDGSDDDQRPVLYQGQSQILTPAGALPINFEMEAESLEDAVNKFGDAAKQAVEDTIKQIEEMRREQASSILVPGQGAPGAGGMGGMGGSGGMPGSKIQMP